LNEHEWSDDSGCFGSGRTRHGASLQRLMHAGSVKTMHADSIKKMHAGSVKKNNILLLYQNGYLTL
jgi:hypothetical protein